MTDILDERPDGAWLDVDAAAALLDLCGLPMMPFRLVSSADEAVEAGLALGDPVVLKATGLERLSKSESGGVSLDVHGPDELRAAYERMVGAARRRHGAGHGAVHGPGRRRRAGGRAPAAVLRRGDQPRPRWLGGAWPTRADRSG